METKKKGKKKEQADDLFHYMKILIGIFLAAFIVLACYFSYRFGRMVFSDAGRTNSRVTNITYDLTVEKGESVLSVGQKLENAGIIDSAIVFWVQSKVFSVTIYPGTYTVSSKSSSKAILKSLGTSGTN